MSERKQTPDVLADILGAGAAPSEPAPAPSRSPRAEAPRREAPAQASEQKKAAGKTRTWEHTVVSFQEYHGWRPRYENGVELAGWTQGLLLPNYLEKRGREGWELAAATGGRAMFGTADYYQLFLKRPVE
jgi:hypothetical protein